MSEIISFASWDFIEMVCHEHKEELVLKEIGAKPFYVCKEADCKTQITPFVYERIHAEVLAKLNAGTITIGQKWRKKFLGRSYEFKIESNATGKRTRVSVRFIG